MAPRRYDATRRQQQARSTRERILDVAERLFLDEGFAATTIGAIARDAEVSVDTVYKSFGSKPGLVRAIHERGLAGEGDVHAEIRSDELQRSERNPLALMAGIGQLAMEVAPRVAPMMLLIREAATADPEMAALKRDLDDQRLARMTHNARNMRQAGHLRDDLTTQAAGEIMWTYSSTELYELLVIIRGWPLKRYGTFIADALSAALLGTHNHDG